MFLLFEFCQNLEAIIKCLQSLISEFRIDESTHLKQTNKLREMQDIYNIMTDWKLMIFNIGSSFEIIVPDNSFHRTKKHAASTFIDHSPNRKWKPTNFIKD